jgi:hypothetical protein
MFSRDTAVKSWDTEVAEKREEITEQTRVFVLYFSFSLRDLRVEKPDCNIPFHSLVAKSSSSSVRLFHAVIVALGVSHCRRKRDDTNYWKSPCLFIFKISSVIMDRAIYVTAHNIIF